MKFSWQIFGLWPNKQRDPERIEEKCLEEKRHVRRRVPNASREWRVAACARQDDNVTSWDMGTARVIEICIQAQPAQVL